MFGRILIVALVIGGLGGAVIGNCKTKVINESAGQSVDKVIVKKLIETEPSIVTQSILVYRIPRAVTEASDAHAKRQNSGSSLVGPSSKGVTTSKGGGTSSGTGQSSGSGKKPVPPKNPKAPGGAGTGGSTSSKPPKNKPNKREPNRESDSH